jgi:hypothetical protein
MAAAKNIITEHLEKIREKVLCDLIGTPYKIAFNYPQVRVDALKSEFAGYIYTGATNQKLMSI